MTAAPEEDIGIVVLAAGGSRRMNGRPKQLLEFKGNSLLKRAANTALATRCRPVVIVLGAEEEKLRTEIANLPLTILVNKNWKEGLGSSIKAGISKLLDIQPDLDAAILTLCDQPLIDSAILERLVKTYHETGKSIVAAEYQDTAGVPALFSRGIFEKLLNLHGLSGAKSIIQSESSMVAKVLVPEAAIDIDSPQDHELLSQQFKR